MAPDSEKGSWQKMREEIWAKERQEYADDPAVWMSKLISANRGETNDQIRYHSDKQEEKAKDIAQAVADSQRRCWSGVESRLIFWSGIIAVILAASAGLLGLRGGLVVGATLVGLVVVGRVYLRTRFVRKQMNRLDRFRKRFRELLDAVNDPLWRIQTEEMVAEDKAFLGKYKDSILFPSAIPYGRRESIWPYGDDLRHIETLYVEYCSHKLSGPGGPSELEKTADRVRKHIENALSAVESNLESTRQALITRIDGASAEGAVSAKDFLEVYCKREGFYPPEALAEQDEKLLAWLNSLRGKQRWTFAEADKVRELCRMRKEGKSDWPERYEMEARLGPIFDKLTREMKGAATRCELTEVWNRYDNARERLSINERTFGTIRRIIGRHEPEAMFRELEEVPGRLLLLSLEGRRNVLLPGLENYGYDGRLVTAECRRARKLISKERDKYDRDRDRERNRDLQAMQAFVRAERQERE